MTLIDHSHILEILSSLGFSSTDFLVRTKLLKFVSTLDLSLNPRVIYRRQFHFFPRMFNRSLRVNTLPDPKPAPSTTFPVSAVDYARYPNQKPVVFLDYFLSLTPLFQSFSKFHWLYLHIYQQSSHFSPSPFYHPIPTCSLSSDFGSGLLAPCFRHHHPPPPNLFAELQTC